MQEDIEGAIDKAKQQMDQALQHLERDLLRLRTGKASTDLVANIMVPYYGSSTPLAQVANVSLGDSRSLVIQPWEKNMIPVIERAIFEGNLGLTPMSDGETVRINIPPLTEERRRDLAKQAKAAGEDAKISVRNARRDANNLIQRQVKDGFPEDQAKSKEKHIQEMTDSHIEQIDATVAKKEKEILTV